METPPSSQALQRRLIVNRKQCVYSDLPRKNEWGSDGATLYKKPLPNKSLSTSTSTDKVGLRRDVSDSSVADSSIGEAQKYVPVAPPFRRQSVQSTTGETHKNVPVAPTYRRKSVHAVVHVEKHRRRGAKIF